MTSDNIYLPFSELDRIIQGTADLPSVVQESYTNISSPYTSLFAEESLRSPRKKRKCIETDSDLVSSQRTGIQGSDPLVLPSEGQGQANIPKNTSYSRPKPSVQKTLHDIIKKQCGDMIQLTVCVVILLL